MAYQGPNRRKQVLIEKRIQLRHTGLLIASFVLILVLIEAQFYSLFKSMLPKIAQVADASYLAGLSIVVMVEMLVIVGIVGFINVLYMHRVVGPVARITRMLGEMADSKNYFHVTIRKKDELHMMVHEINRLIDSIKHK
jgi:nitrate/nitrite-specific signal transduction histidine kinase